MEPNATSLSNLKSLANSVRDELFPGRDARGGDCEPASDLLVEKLKAWGIDAYIVFGSYKNEPHSWVIFGDRYIDPTYDQFDLDTTDPVRVGKTTDPGYRRDYDTHGMRYYSSLLIARKDVIGQVYLLHFNEPYKHARHYLGWALNAESRIQQHENGTGARLTQVIRDAGIGFQVAKIWEGKTRNFERSLKNQGGLNRQCPICKAQGLDSRKNWLKSQELDPRENWAPEEIQVAPETPESGPDFTEVPKVACLAIIKAAAAPTITVKKVENDEPHQDPSHPKYELEMILNGEKIGKMEVIAKPAGSTGGKYEGPHLKIHSVWINPDMRRKGYGTLLYNRAKQLAKELGLPHIYSDYSVSDEARAVWKNKLHGEEFRDVSDAPARYRMEAAKENDWTVVYHGTDVDNIPLMKKQGILPSENHLVWAADTLKEAQRYGMIGVQDYKWNADYQRKDYNPDAQYAVAVIRLVDSGLQDVGGVWQGREPIPPKAIIRFDIYNTKGQLIKTAAESSLRQLLEGLKGELSSDAQLAYDDWKGQSGRGLCDSLAEGMAYTINVQLGHPDPYNITDETKGRATDINDSKSTHFWVYVEKGEEKYGVDIPYGIYETEKSPKVFVKKPGVKLTAEDVHIFPVKSSDDTPWDMIKDYKTASLDFEQLKQDFDMRREGVITKQEVLATTFILPDGTCLGFYDNPEQTQIIQDPGKLKSFCVRTGTIWSEQGKDQFNIYERPKAIQMDRLQTMFQLNGGKLSWILHRGLGGAIVKKTNGGYWKRFHRELTMVYEEEDREDLKAAKIAVVKNDSKGWWILPNGKAAELEEEFGFRENHGEAAQRLGLSPEHGDYAAALKWAKTNGGIRVAFWEGGWFFEAAKLDEDTKSRIRGFLNDHYTGGPIQFEQDLPFRKMEDFDDLDAALEFLERSSFARFEATAASTDKFQWILAEQYPEQVDLYHESPIENYSSIKERGLTEEATFATIEEPSGFVSGDKVIVRFSVPRKFYSRICMDMRYGGDEDYFFAQHSVLKGADVAYNAKVPKAWIKELEIVKTAAKKKFYYHSTLARNLNSIAKQGLKPSTDPQWGGMLGDFSMGKLLFTATPKGAMFYAIQLFHSLLENNEVASPPVCLRFYLENEEVHEDTEAQEDYWTEATIPPNRIQIWWHGAWQSLKRDSAWEDMVYVKRDNGWEDWEGIPFDTTNEVESDVKSYAYPKTAAVTPRRPSLLYQYIDSMTPEMKAAAQKIYDEWDSDDEDNEYGGGGICDAISQAMSGALAGNASVDFEIADGGQPGDDHAWFIVYNDTEAWGVDLPHSLYERGGGYSWKKVPGVEFSASDIEIFPVEREGLDFDKFSSTKTAKNEVLILNGIPANERHEYEAPAFVKGETVLQGTDLPLEEVEFKQHNIKVEDGKGIGIPGKGTDARNVSYLE
jgi:GNAT superfamily N-acetyltransferase